MKDYKKIGIICEYNPFHNGHVYHLEKVKEMFPDSLIILVMSTCFTERGEVSTLNKWDKTELALLYGVDLVVELPHFYATNSADFFAHGAIKILSLLGCDCLVFGSECNDIESFEQLSDIQLSNKEYDNLVKTYMQEGLNYPTSLSKALFDLTKTTIKSPNDLLGLSYVKQIKLQNSRIIPVTIKRTNDYHSEELDSSITSATSIRKALERKQDITNYIPFDNEKYIINYDFQDRFFNLLKYKLVSEFEHLDEYLDVSEGLDKRIRKYLLKSKNYQELIGYIKTKRYTYNRLNRMFIHIITNTKKSDVDTLKEINYIKVLGFTKKGRIYLKKLQKECSVPIITNYSQLDDPVLNYQLQITLIYNLIINKEELNAKEFKSIPILK